LFASLTLHTRLGDYVLRYVNEKSARKFVEYIEKRRLERKNGSEEQKSQPKKPKPNKFSKEAEQFLNSHEVAVISTIGRTGTVQGAVVYYYAPGDGRVYFITKAETDKAHNILYSGQVALTIFDEQNLQTLQLEGQAMIENDPDMKQTIFTQLIHSRNYGNEKRMPPITQLHEGAFMVINITPTNSKFTDFKKLP
jgi:general stress protein 26